MQVPVGEGVFLPVVGFVQGLGDRLPDLLVEAPGIFRPAGRRRVAAKAAGENMIERLVVFDQLGGAVDEALGEGAEGARLMLPLLPPVSLTLIVAPAVITGLSQQALVHAGTPWTRCSL